MQDSGLAVKGAEGSNSANVGRVNFDPKDGVSFTVLSNKDIEEVRNGEERTEFLPTWYIDTCWPRTTKIEQPGET
jgi:hypothetical protein